MKGIIKFVLIPLLLFSALSCEKIAFPNPAEQAYPAAPFTLGVTEKRCYAKYASEISADGSWTGDQTELTVTAWNGVTVTSKDDGGPVGVNVSSSDPRVVGVEKTGDNSFSIVYQRDGEVDIRVWNSGQETVFHVSARESIPLEGLRMRVDGKEFVAKVVPGVPGPYDKDSPYDWENNRYTEDMVYFEDYVHAADYSPYEIAILDIVPSNASWRSIEKLQIANLFTTDDSKDGWISFCNDSKDRVVTQSSIRDVSSITGKHAMVYPTSSNNYGMMFNARYLIVTFRTNFKDYSSPFEQRGYATVICSMRVSK